MSASSRELIEQLMGSGLSQRQIGQAINRDSSLISQVARGVKPGTNLRDSLDALRARLEAGQGAGMVSPPERRTTKAGATARTRRKTVVGGRSWATGTTGRQASRNGARSLTKVIAGAPNEVAADATFARWTVYNGSGGVTTKGKETTVTIKLGSAEYVARMLADTYDGNVAVMVVDRMVILGMIAGPTSEALARLVRLEVRGW